MIRVSKYSGNGRGPGEELSKQGTACVGARRTGASRPGEGRATDCGGEPMGAGSHRRIKGVLYDQICILKDDFSCYGNWGGRNWRNHVAAATLLGEL